MENMIPEVVDPIRVGGFAVAISIFVNVLVQFMKSPRVFKEVMKKVPVAWKGLPLRAGVVAVLVLGITSLSQWLLGLSVQEAASAGTAAFFMAIASYKIVAEDIKGNKTGEVKGKETPEPPVE